MQIDLSETFREPTEARIQEVLRALAALDILRVDLASRIGGIIKERGLVKSSEDFLRLRLGVTHEVLQRASALLIGGVFLGIPVHMIPGDGLFCSLSVEERKEPAAALDQCYKGPRLVERELDD